MHFTAEGVSIIIFSILMVVIGYFYSKKNSNSSENFFLSGRKNSVWLIVAGHVMGWVGAGTLVGVYGTAYTSGIAAGIWYPIGFTVSFFLFGAVMARRIKRLGDERQIFTMTEIIRKRFSSSVGGVYLTFETIQSVAYIVGQYMSIAIILDLALGLPYRAACITSGVIVLIYVALGGLTGSLVVTLLQMGICIVGLILAVVVGSHSMGGFANLMASIPEGWNANIFAGQTVGNVLEGFLPTFLASFIYSSMYIRCFSAKDQKTAVNACYLSGIIAILIVTLTALGVYVCVAMVPGLSSGDYALIEMFRRVLPFGAALFAAAIVAACMSTASEAVIGVSMIITNDVIKGILKIQLDEKKTVAAGRLAMAGVTLVSCVIAIFMTSVLDLMYYASNIIAAFVPSYLLGLFWDRVNQQGMMAGILSGGAVVILWNLLPGASALMGSLYAGILVSVLATVIVTMLFPAPEAEKINFIRPFKSAKYEKPV